MTDLHKPTLQRSAQHQRTASSNTIPTQQAQRRRIARLMASLILRVHRQYGAPRSPQNASTS